MHVPVSMIELQMIEAGPKDLENLLFLCYTLVLHIHTFNNGSYHSVASLASPGPASRLHFFIMTSLGRLLADLMTS